MEGKMFALMLMTVCAVPGDGESKKEELKQERKAAALLESWGVKVDKDQDGRVIAVNYGTWRPDGTFRAIFENRDAMCEPLRHLKRLRNLRLTGMQITARGLANIEELTDLEQLDLSTCRGVDDDAMACLAGLRNLVELKLHGGRFSRAYRNVTGAGVAHLEKLTKLQRLEMTAMNGTDYDLHTLTSLRRLILAGTTFSDKDMEGLAKLTDLEELNLSGTSITDEGMKHLAGLKKLHTLRLNGGPITDTGMKSLHGLSALRYVELYDTKVSEDAVQALGQAVPELAR
jgi:hypothetical protein